MFAVFEKLVCCIKITNANMLFFKFYPAEIVASGIFSTLSCTLVQKLSLGSSVQGC